MKSLISKTAGTLAVAGAIVILTGCASTSELSEVRAIAEEARSNSERALQEAQQANQCCNDTNEKIDRMFKRSMYK
jgi:hypothetical protein